jgi:hypothetical protein
MPNARARLAVALTAFAGVGALVFACGTDAVGIDACRQVESARCLQAPNCGIDLTIPVHRDTPKTDIDACIRFYHEQCLHGLAAAKDPGTQAVKECVDAINTGDCKVVKDPTLAPACTWLIPPAPPPEADAAAVDAADSATVEAGYQCLVNLPGCVDLGTAAPICQGRHECACAGSTSDFGNCWYAGGNAEGSTSYYCCP